MCVPGVCGDKELSLQHLQEKQRVQIIHESGSCDYHPSGKTHITEEPL